MRSRTSTGGGGRSSLLTSWVTVPAWVLFSSNCTIITWGFSVERFIIAGLFFSSKATPPYMSWPSVGVVDSEHDNGGGGRGDILGIELTAVWVPPPVFWLTTKSFFNNIGCTWLAKLYRAKDALCWCCWSCCSRSSCCCWSFCCCFWRVAAVECLNFPDKRQFLEWMDLW